jgi:hypothetical protein
MTTETTVIRRRTAQGLRLTCMLLACCMLALTGRAQLNNRVQNKPYIDLRKFHYGFSIGLHQQSLKMPNSGYIDPETGQQWMVSNSKFSPGFTVGLIGDWRICNYLSFRVLPTMHFQTNSISFKEQSTGQTDYQEMKSTYISLPLNLKICAPRHNNYRPYIITGVSASYDLTAKDQDNIAVKPLSFAFELGFGCDYYLPFFKCCPELKFSFGLNDILKTDRSNLTDKSKEVFTKSVKDAHTTMVILTLHFE